METLSVVIPVYNEEENISHLLKTLAPILESIENLEYEIIFTLDPSDDNTEETILKERSQNNRVKLLTFSRRVGQPIATLAGLHRCKGDAAVVMDADLQDPPEIIPDMVVKWREGYDVVYATRKDRKYENIFRRLFGHLYYGALNSLSDTKIPRNTGDFRLINRRVIDALSGMKETHSFLRGMVALVGFRQTAVFYARRPRSAGQTKYNPVTGSLKIALNGIIPFSNKLLRLISLAGFVFGFIWMLLVLLKVFSFLYPHIAVIGEISYSHLLLMFLGIVQLLSIGILGEYISRIYDQVKNRPLYIVDREEGF